jgi:hypothetical protein
MWLVIKNMICWTNYKIIKTKKFIWFKMIKKVKEFKIQPKIPLIHLNQIWKDFIQKYKFLKMKKMI